MSRAKFYELMRRFEESLIGVTGRAMPPQDYELITPEKDRARCAKALDALSATWILEPQDLTKLQQLNQRCLELLKQGDVNAALFAAKDVQLHLIEVRERARPSKGKMTL
ncbi:hypothetical protein [Variovorax paradoxus]|uniref:hypothetical protein n=1 Tax=Variovorax paradoxus TaxID=34073 RepID=UPI003ECE4B00